MKKKRLLISFLSFVMIIMPISVFAHPGGLDSNKCHSCRTNCAKWGLDDDEYHCHSDDTYTNKKGEVYDETGSKISGNNTSSNTTTSTTTTTTKKVETTTKKAETITTKTSTTKQNTTIKKSTTTTQIKNKDTSLKYIKIDNQDISILDIMNYETSKKNIELNIVANDSKAKVDFNNPELKIGENEIVIKVTAETGNIKEYKIIVTRNEVKSTVVIKKFILGASEVKFENNKASIRKLSNESSFKYSYELSDKNAKLLLYVNDKEVKELNNIKNKDIIKLVVVDCDYNKNIYEIEVAEVSETESAIINAIAYTIIAGIFLSPVIIIGVIIYIKKRKK